MRPRAGSQLIDRGQNVGFKFNGAAPDLGWFETGAPLTRELDAADLDDEADDDEARALDVEE